ncbi:MAG: IS110 family transposase [Pyrinomonadaceae bacterium]
MRIVYKRCCGLDVHKKVIVACLLLLEPDGELRQEIRKFGTMTKDLLELLDWLQQAGCTHVAMESTGVYWKPIYNLLEGHLEVVVVNAQHLKGVPGRKTDVLDAEWLAECFQLGLLKASFIPPAPVRELRDLTRYRTSLIRERGRTANRLQKVLEDANIKLASVVTDIQGASAWAMLQAIVAGKSDPEALANLAKGLLRKKREQLVAALSGMVKPHHRFLIAEHLSQIEYLEEAIQRIGTEVEERLRPFEEDVKLLDSIPGIGRQTAEVLLAEIGWDMSRFPSDKNLASWAGMCPGNNESAGKRRNGKTRKGSRWLRHALIEAAHGAARTKNKYLKTQYHRVAAHRGKKKALVAVGHSILIISYHLLTRRQQYTDLGANYFDERDRNAVQRRCVKRLEKLGYKVELQPTALAA